MLKANSKITKKKLLAAVMAIAMMLTAALPMLSVSAAPGAGPVAVDGRILTPNQTGDSSNWVEIARYGNSSLIVRADFINIIGGNYYGNPAWQYFSYGNDAKYMTSFIRDRINHWFSGVPVAANWEDVLPASARLRSYTLQHNAVNALGTSNTVAAMTDGLSVPSAYQVGIGNDIAFALSYSESANFLSNIHFQRNNNLADQPSNAYAAANVQKINLPDPTTNFFLMWLRSPGDLNGMAAELGNEGRNRFRTFQSDIGNRTSKGLIYPALWVDSDIFGPTVVTYNVTYYPNGGTGSVNAYPANSNTSYLIMDQGYTRSMYTFDGWNTAADGSGASYQNFNVINITGNVNLYAQWKRESSIVYDANGGVGADFVDYGNNGTFTIRSNMFTRPQYAFREWNTSPNGTGAILPAGLTFSNFNGTLRLYAIWIRID